MLLDPPLYASTSDVLLCFWANRLFLIELLYSLLYEEEDSDSNDETS